MIRLISFLEKNIKLHITFQFGGFPHDATIRILAWCFAKNISHFSFKSTSTLSNSFATRGVEFLKELIKIKVICF